MERHVFRATPSNRGRRRPRLHVVRRANVAIVGIALFYALVAVVVINARHWGPVRRALHGAEDWHSGGDPSTPDTQLHRAVARGNDR